MRERSVLVAKRRIPYPIEIGSDAVSFALLHVLKDIFRVTLLTVDDGARAVRAAEHLRSLGIDVQLVPEDRGVATRPVAVGSVLRNTRLLLSGTPRNYQSQACRHLEAPLKRLTQERRYTLTQFENWATARYRRFAHGPAVLLNHDAWFRTVEAFARYERSRIARLFWRLEARAVRRYEVKAQEDFEWALFLSTEDQRDILGGSQPNAAVLPVPFPFRPLDPDSLRPQRSSPRVAFVGAMNVEFNVDAACYFAERIWPTVRQAVPDALFIVAGRRPAERVQRLAQQPGIDVNSDPDLDALLQTSQLAVSPARIGTGIKVKVAQAMAVGLPVVGTPVGLSGFGGIDCLRGVEDEREFARQVVRLLEDAAHRQRFGRACYEAYRDNLWMESARPKVAALYDRIVEDLETTANGRSLAPAAASGHI